MAHRAVLACCSPYLFEIFNSDVEPHGVSHVTFEDLDPEAVEVLLNYAYTAQLVAFLAFHLLIFLQPNKRKTTMIDYSLSSVYNAG